MPSRSIRITLSLLTIVLLVLLAACVRPVPDQEVPPTATPAAAQPEQPAEGGEVVPPETGEQPAQPEQPAEGGEAQPPTEEQPAEGESPRPEDGATEGEVIVEEGSTTPEDVTEGNANPPATEEQNPPQEQESAPPAEQVPPPANDTTQTSPPAVGVQPAQEVIHTVQPGENLYRIGLQYGYSWVVLQQYNGLPNANYIVVGQQIRIPGNSGTGGGTPDPLPPDGTYVVQAGDTLYSIGRRFGVDYRLIAEANGIVNPNYILVGQVLKIPAPTPYDSTTGSTSSGDPGAAIGGAGEITHVVQANETLYSVALRYGVPWPFIAETNSLELPYTLFEGQTLVISTGK